MVGFTLIQNVCQIWNLLFKLIQVLKSVIAHRKSKIILYTPTKHAKFQTLSACTSHVRTQSLAICLLCVLCVKCYSVGSKSHDFLAVFALAYSIMSEIKFLMKSRRFLIRLVVLKNFNNWMIIKYFLYHFWLGSQPFCCCF